MAAEGSGNARVSSSVSRAAGTCRWVCGASARTRLRRGLASGVGDGQDFLAVHQE